MYLREKFYDQLPPMPDAVSFDVTQAAQWFMRDDERIEYPWEEYGGLTPPYPELWMELVFPTQLRTGQGMIDTPPFLHSAGLLLKTREIDEQQAESIRGKHYPFLHATLNEYAPGPARKFVNVDGNPDCDTPPRWVVVGETFGAGKRQVAVFNRWAMTLDERGKYLRHLAQTVPWGLLALAGRCSLAEAERGFWRMGAAQRWELQEAMRDEFELPFLFCLALMHCENVNEVEQPPQPPPVRKRQPRQRVPEIRYKVLSVTPAAVKHRGPASEGGGEVEPKALHFVRGHFKDYSVKGLFGRYKGVYWWDSQVRGEVNGGVVDKDYRVRRE